MAYNKIHNRMVLICPLYDIVSWVSYISYIIQSMCLMQTLIIKALFVRNNMLTKFVFILYLKVIRLCLYLCLCVYLYHV